jgi:hypothetical protein
MKDSDTFRENAENCLYLAEKAVTDALANRYRRMAEAWRSLADEQDWLDGHTPPKWPPRGLDADNRA